MVWPNLVKKNTMAKLRLAKVGNARYRRAFVLDGTNGCREKICPRIVTHTIRENECQITTQGPFRTTMKLKQGR